MGLVLWPKQVTAKHTHSYTHIDIMTDDYDDTEGDMSLHADIKLQSDRSVLLHA